MSELLSREEVVAHFGPMLSARTLRYWESNGLLPRPVRLGRRVYYPSGILPRIAALVATRPAAVAKLRRESRSEVIVEQHGDNLILKVRFRKGG